MKQVYINGFKVLAEINVEDSSLSIVVSVPEQTNPKEKIIRINTFDVQSYLLSNGYDIGECTQGAVVGDDSKNILTGTWIFAILENSKPKKKKSPQIDKSIP